MNYRIFVEKKKEFQTESLGLLNELNNDLHLGFNSIRVLQIYDVFNIEKTLFEVSKKQVFQELVTDDIYDNITLDEDSYLAYECLPGQFDQRADSAMQCIKLIDSNTDVVVRSGKLIIFDRKITKQEKDTLKKYLINEVESREKNLSVLELPQSNQREDVLFYDGFIDYSAEELKKFYNELGLAMSFLDFKFIQDYFKNEEKRNPSETEIKLLDTYWSDHCRHTTFETAITDISFASDSISDQIKQTFLEYLQMRKMLNRDDKPITLMDMATINARFEKMRGNLEDLEQSDENNACSIYMDLDVDGKKEKWLLMFKNETHNHPTEIEPFGGASTCIGGAIRDPLSGRSYVYQAMRITGAANILENVEETLEGKLPQKKISKQAAHGYSSYGNQIGLATTYVKEIFDEGYKAKRMEVGAVVGACPLEHVRREKPANGDVVILLGGRTGRDGIGGATGSSKEHNETSLEKCSAEVQKGNAPEERKIQRLFRNKEATILIKKSNDFGAGGVSVAIGELADGVDIKLDSVLTKYDGLSATEIAISESQERMSVVVEAKDADKFIDLCRKENIEAYVIAKVTDKNRLKMTYNGQVVVDISRDFINTNGVRQETKAVVSALDNRDIMSVKPLGNSLLEKSLNTLSSLNCCMQKGLVEMFDASIGATTVLMPYGGKYQLTESQVSCQKIPVLSGNTDTCSVMAYGYNPTISKWNSYYGAMYAIIESMAKLVAVGVSYDKIRFSFQEYFERLNKDESKWGTVVQALLGTIKCLKEFGLASIGGKDSMSGTFKDLHIPPTLISFAVSYLDSNLVVSNELKRSGNKLYIIKHDMLRNNMPNYEQLKMNFNYVTSLISSKKIVSSYAVAEGGIFTSLAKMAFGNKLGFEINTDLELFDYSYGSIIVESECDLDCSCATYLGDVRDNGLFVINGIVIKLEDALKANLNPLEELYPTVSNIYRDMDLSIIKNGENEFPKCDNPKKEVKVLIPTFMGTNCEYDTAKAFEEAGAISEIFVFRNLPGEIEKSISELASLIDKTDILAFAGGFSAGDEPDGSGKFIANILNNVIVKNAINRLLDRDGLIIGICNGFQALIKSGLLPYGEIGKVDVSSPTLVKNDINRHVSCIAHTKVSSIQSPWLRGLKLDERHSIAVSHGEGKFVCSQEFAKYLFDNGLVAFQYVDEENNPTMDPQYNVNGSYYGIEGIISPCGKILGKMGHSERKGHNIFKNIYGNKNQDLFKNAVSYLKGE